MGNDPRDERTTIHEARGDGASGRRLSVLVIGDGYVHTHALPPSGAITIGRSKRCDLQIDVPSVSRHHATLHISGELRLEDTGSANGTRVRGQTVPASETVDLAPGDPIELGGATLVIQRHEAAVRRRRLWTHGYFEGRLEDECARKDVVKGVFAVARLRVKGSGDRATATNAILDALRPGDVLASYGPNEYEVLLVDADEPAARKVLGEAELRLKHSAFELQHGLSHYPRDGRSPESLIGAACADLDGQIGEDGSVIRLDPAVTRLYQLADRIAAGTISVLLLGETGVGKEVFAAYIHRASPRANGPYVRLNCAALSDTLAESELFGHEKGAFTGAAGARPGFLESAHQGTLFLDEVGDLSLSLQAKLLRVLEDGEVLRVGAREPRKVDVRFVAATNRDLEAEVEQGRFRRDLYYRISAATLMIPPLRERTREIAPLANLFVARASASLGIEPPPITDQARAILEGYDWPGNVRELRNTMERAVLLAFGDPITPEMLPLDKMWTSLPAPDEANDDADRAGEAPGAAGGDSTPRSAQADKAGPSEVGHLRDQRSAYEKQVIIDALERTGGNQTAAARLLGIARRTLITRMEAYGLPRPRKDKRD